MLLKVLLICFSLNLTVFGADYQGRIVNGTDAEKAEFPFMVSLRRVSTGGHSCGASLLNRAWVLTAAHCVSRALPAMLNIQFGTTVIKRNSTDNLANVSKIFVHKGYAPYNKYIHDIALLKLAQPVTFNDHVQAVKLPEAFQLTPGNTSACLIGWGLNASGGNVQTQLQKVSLQTFSDDECSGRHQTELHSTNICAGIPEGGKGQCSGDSGGPLLVDGTQVGIVSWSRKPCAVAPYPGVFTEVSAYIDWILETMASEPMLRSENDGDDESVNQLMTGNLIVVQHTKTNDFNGRISKDFLKKEIKL